MCLHNAPFPGKILSSFFSTKVMVKFYKDFLELSRFNMVYKLIVLLCFAVNATLSKPIQRTDGAQSESVKKRLNSELQDIVRKTMLQADMHVLRTLPEERLSLIESLLQLWQEEEVAEVTEEMDQEMPQGDEPVEDTYLADSPDGADLARVEYEENSTLGGSFYYDANSSKAYRDINKEMRLNTIKSQILTYLGFAGRTPPVVNSTDLERQRIVDMYEKTKHRPKYPPSESYTEKVQSFYPACELPRNTTSDLWTNNGTVMNLFFNSIHSVLATSTVLKARLRLFKHSPSPDTLLAPEEACSQAPGEEKKKTDGGVEVKTLEDRLIRVSIYWYTRPLKKAKDKKKLLDSQMLSVYGEEWTEWNIKPAVKAWKESPGKNFGLSVIVEDEDGVKLPVDKLFAAMNCSNEASTTRPFPGFFVHSGREPLESQRSGSDTYWSGPRTHHSSLFPIIDLFSVSDEMGGHKVRHHNHHRTSGSH